VEQAMKKFEVMSVTPAAEKRLAEILAANSAAKGIRVGVKNGGCAGMEYTVELATDEKPGEDRVDTPSGAVFVAPSAVLFLLGTQMDFSATKLKTGFVFNNPNQQSACGCGESVELKPAEMTPEMLQARSGPGAVPVATPKAH
jgi:iron-sulfur cluster assembly protein